MCSVGHHVGQSRVFLLLTSSSQNSIPRRIASWLAMRLSLSRSRRPQAAASFVCAFLARKLTLAFLHSFFETLVMFYFGIVGRTRCDMTNANVLAPPCALASVKTLRPHGATAAMP
jgi:hypothetical protein